VKTGRIQARTKTGNLKSQVVPGSSKYTQKDERGPERQAQNPSRGDILSRIEGAKNVEKEENRKKKKGR